MLDFLLDLIYPKYLTCSLCQKDLDLGGDQPLCKVCLSSLQYISLPACELCGQMLSRHATYGVCDSCKLLEANFHRGHSIWIYDDFIKGLIFKFKYKEASYLYDWLADQMVLKLARLDLPFEFDHVVPVPMHVKRFKSRGYDPLGCLCKSFSDKTGIAYSPVVKRTVDTPQLYAYSAQARKTILQGAFGGEEEIAGNVLLVDDIFTTGQTINHCSGVLKALGADYIFALSLCVGQLNP